ncbi:MAG: DNA gyrase/topoisomerase IV subunit A, partial [Flavobacteriaceae bacterium]|nr:DNA gyrase/topoisomerase IV subunit A [Flavobacteriaceae bacterium]
GRGELLGEFKPEDKLMIVTQAGKIKVQTPDLTMHFEDDTIILEKWNPLKPISAIYYDGDKERYFVKRFMIDNPNKEEIFITEHPKSHLEIVLTDYRPMAEVILSGKGKENIIINLEEFIAVKGIKAIGNQLTTDKIKQINALASLPYEPPQVAEVEVIDEEVIKDSIEDENPKSDINSDEIIADDEGQTLLF